MNRPLTLLSALIIMTTASACSAGERTDQTEPKSGAAEMTTTLDYRTVPLETITGDTTTLADLQGKALLLVNVASECGYTPQYAGLEQLYRAYKDSGLIVIGFPANNFGGQEPGTNAQILNFCTTRFDVTFPMMAKVSVKGADKHPLFAYLTEQSSLPGDIKWNFSKFVLDRDGNLIARFDSGAEPMSEEILGAVTKALAVKN